jgi:hypothetical protein
MEEELEKIYTASTLIGVILAIVSAFISVPLSAAGLLVLGGIGALNNANTPELRLGIYAAGILLILGAKSLTAIPVAGAALAAIFSGIATLLIGASVVGVTFALYHLIKSNLLK